MKVIFSNRAYAGIMAETAEKIKTETGGLFLGTVKNDIFYVIESIDPGPKSVFEIAYFEYDQKYTQHLINKIANLYDAKLSLIGLWHRHPGSFDVFSSTDDGTNTKYASMRKEGAISALVNIDPIFRLTVYHVDYPHKYDTLSYEVGDDFIPNELLKLKTPERFLSIMENILHPESVEQDTYSMGVSFASFLKLVLPHLEETEYHFEVPQEENQDESGVEIILSELFNDLTYITDELKINIALAKADDFLILYQDTYDGTTKVYFSTTDDNRVILSYKNTCYKYSDGILKQAFQISKAEVDKSKQEFHLDADEKSSGFLGTVAKIIRFKKEED